MDGQIAEVGLWNIDIASVSNLDDLASGYSPIMVAPRNLVAYWPLHGRAGAGGDEEDWVGGELLTQVSSPALADHPRIIYPRRRSMIFVPAVVGGAPTLSDLKAASITATTVQGTYDYVF